MSNLKKKLVLVLVTGFLFANLSASAFAAYSEPKSTVLPDTKGSVEDCQSLMTYVKQNIVESQTAMADRFPSSTTPVPPHIKDVNGFDNGITYKDVLACGIKTGDIMMWMVPFYIRWVLEFVIGLAGIASVGGFVVGGYFYLFAGISQDKEKGKNAIKNALIGLTLTLTAWAIVNIVISLVSS